MQALKKIIIGHDLSGLNTGNIASNSNNYKQLDVSGNAEINNKLFVNQIEGVDNNSDICFNFASIHDVTSLTINSSGSSSNNIVLTNGNITMSGMITAKSDQRIKTNIRQLNNCLNKIDDIHGYMYNRTDLQDSNMTHIGVIAQEVEKQFPEIVEEDKSTSIKSVSYDSIVPILIECIHELKAENNTLKSQMNYIMQRVEKMHNQVKISE